MITMRHISAGNTTMLAHHQGLAHSCSTLAAILRRELRGDLQYPTASVFSFARKDQKEGAPRYVGYGLGQMMILEQTGNVQVFNDYCVELANDLEGCLMMKIRSLSSDLLMLSPQQSDGFAPPSSDVEWIVIFAYLPILFI